jgi:rifampin ADP-ribosylating transferase
MSEENPNVGQQFKWYHGSMKQLEPGQYIVPPKGSSRAKQRTAKNVSTYDRSKVYVSKNYGVAYMFATPQDKTRGYVYEVEPVGEVKPDTDGFLKRLAHSADAARVIRAVKEGDKVEDAGGYYENKPAPKTAADEAVPPFSPYVNSYAGKCRQCGKKVGAREGSMVKTFMQAPKYEVYHKECLG